MLVTKSRKITASSLTDRNQQLLAALNLSVIMTTSMSAMNPRRKAKAVWVGLDVHAPDDKSKTMKELADIYFKATEQESENLYWSPVIKKHTKNGFLYEASSDKHLYQKSTGKYDVVGFIFLSDNEMQVLFNKVNDIAFDEFGDEAPVMSDAELEAAAQKIIDDELAEYSMWLNSEFTDVTVSTLDDEHVSWVNGASDINTGFEDSVKDVLNDVDNDRNAMSMVLQIKGDYLSDEIDILSNLTSTLQKKFGVQLTYGNYAYNSNLKEFSVNFVGNKIPAMHDLTRDSANGIVNAVEKNSKTLVGAGKFDSIDTWDIVSRFS